MKWLSNLLSNKVDSSPLPKQTIEEAAKIAKEFQAKREALFQEKDLRDAELALKKFDKLTAYHQQQMQSLITTGSAGWATPAATGIGILQQSPWTVTNPGTAAGTSHLTFVNQPHPTPIHVTSPFGANLIATGPMKTVIAVRTMKDIQGDPRIQDQDIVLCLDTMKMWECCAGPTGLMREVRLDENLHVIEIPQPVYLPPERKEVFDVFEKTLDKIEERKDDRTWMQKAKAFVMDSNDIFDKPALT